MIGKIIRDTKVQDTAYIADMKEWIPEAMEMMQTRQETVGDIAEKMIDFHKARLPCGLLYIDAVEYRGRRIPMGNSVKNIRQPSVNHHHGPEDVSTTWQSVTFKYPAPGDQTYLYFSTLQKTLANAEDHHHYYEIELGTILTSFPQGKIRIYYRKTASDKDGMPLIPDNINYKTAIYWYVLGKMIGAGFDYHIVKWEECEDRFEKFAARAMEEISYPSPNEMEHRINTFARLIPPDNYFERYFRVDRPEGMYDPMGLPGEGGSLGPSDTYYV